MTNKTIAAIFMVLSWTLLALAVYGGMPIMTFYGIIVVGMSTSLYYRQG